MRQSVLFIVCALLLISCAVKQTSTDKDLDFIYNSILENHPGVYNKEDPDFCQNLENSYIIAKSKIKKSRSSTSIRKAISYFTQSFNDTHLGLKWFDNLPQKQKDIIPTFSIAELSDNILWVTLPTFDLKIEQEKNFSELVKDIAVLLKKNYIIFDLRGNQGGNSDYGSQITDALFGNEYAHLRRCLHNKRVFVDWRASWGNLSHTASLLMKYPNNQWLQDIPHKLKESLEKGDIFYREYSPGACGAEKNIVSQAKFKVIVITESINVSAALDFIDELKIMTKDIILVGQKTKADRLYMEVRTLPLPSGSGNFFLPIKVYRNRQRLDNEPYVPDIEFNDVHNILLLQNFILEKIKRKEF